MLQTIKLGSDGSLVKVAKYLMKYSTRNNAAGTYDTDFFNYVSTWQKNNGLEIDGIIGPSTWKKIASVAPTCSTSKNKTSPYTCAVQLLVGGLTVDGIYGTKTKNGVAAYQTANKLSADGICGPKTWNSLIVGKSDSSGSTTPSQTNTNGKVLNKCVHYVQWDSKWKNIKYSTHTSSQTIGNSGCGPTAMADIMATWVDKKITPVEMCKLSMENGYRTYNSGTAWAFFEFVFKKYNNFSKFLATGSVETLIGALGEGALAICSMNSNDNGFWTKGGHFVTAIGYDSSGYIYANDPNKSSAPRKQLKSKFKSCLKQAFIFWPIVEKKEDTPVEEDKSIGDPAPPIEEPIKEEVKKTGTKIIDVAKYQGTINWDKLAPELAFVIIKASGLYKNGTDPQYANNVKGAVSHGVPFHVYHFLYCTTESEAKRDAALFYNSVKEQGYMPLVWVLDCEAAWGVSDKDAPKIAKVFEDELRRLAGQNIRVAIYAGHNKYSNWKMDYAHYDYVWIPRYGSNDGTVGGSIKPSYHCDLWQYTSKGKIAGISGDVDMSIVTGDGKSIDWFVK